MEETINTIIDMIVSTACPLPSPPPPQAPLSLSYPFSLLSCLAETQHGAIGECLPVTEPVPCE